MTAFTAPGGARRLELFLATAAVIVMALLVVLIAGAIGRGFLPHDFLAYDLAVRHLLAGEPLYDLSATSTGGLGLFLYPPSFALLLLPVALVPSSAAAPIWMYLLIVASVVAIWILSVSRTVRWVLTIGLGLSAPLIGAVAQGQVGPVLLLLFAIAWRFIDRQAVVGSAIALGATIKIQPVILLVWALGTGHRRAAAIAVLIAGGLGLIATLIVGPSAWLDLVTVLARTNQPLLTLNSVGVGRLAYEAGAPEGVAWSLYAANLVTVGIAFLVAIRRATPLASFLVGVVASQMISPVIWQHYAVVLFLPVAWLLSRGRWWAILILAPTSIPIAAFMPPAVYPFVFWLTLLATLGEGMIAAGRDRIVAPTPPQLRAT